MRQLELIKEPILEWDCLCGNGCGCIYWKIKTSKHPIGISVIEKCDLHSKNPTAFGGISCSIKKGI